MRSGQLNIHTMTLLNSITVHKATFKGVMTNIPTKLLYESYDYEVVLEIPAFVRYIHERMHA